MIANSPEIIGAQFLGWIADLSLPDPFYILPIIAGVLQLGGKMKIIMPIVFTAVMIKLPVAVIIFTITSSFYSLLEKGFVSGIIDSKTSFHCTIKEARKEKNIRIA